MATLFKVQLGTFVSPSPHPRAAAVDVNVVDRNRWQRGYILPLHKMLPVFWALIKLFRGRSS
jgi:hypothetical protein